MVYLGNVLTAGLGKGEARVDKPLTECHLENLECQTGTTATDWEEAGCDPFRAEGGDKAFGTDRVLCPPDHLLNGPATKSPIKMIFGFYCG